VSSLLPASIFLISQQIMGLSKFAICGKKVLVKIWSLRVNPLRESRRSDTSHFFHLATSHTWWRISLSTFCAQKFNFFVNTLHVLSYKGIHHDVGNNQPQECDKVRRHKFPIIEIPDKSHSNGKWPDERDKREQRSRNQS